MAMHNSGVLGLNEGALENIILELNDEIDKIDFSLKQIEMDMYDTSDYFKGDVPNSIREKFEKYSKLVPTIKANLTSYTTDLIAIKNGVTTFSTKLTSGFRDLEADHKSKGNSVNDSNQFLNYK